MKCSRDTNYEVSILKLIGEYRGEGRINGYWFAAMEYHKGLSLNQLINGNKIKCTRDFEYYKQVLYDTVSNLHSRNITHRDVHGANMLFELDGRASVTPIDWGNAMTRKQAGKLGFWFSIVQDYFGVDLMILKARILFYQKHGISMFWMKRREFCVE